MTSLRYKNPVLNRRRKLLDKDKKERRSTQERKDKQGFFKKEKLQSLIEHELQEELYEVY